MRRLTALVRKDLRRAIARPLAPTLLLAFPLIFAGLFALAFAGGGSGMPKAQLLVDDRDGGLGGQLILAAFGSEQMGEFLEVESVTEEEGIARLEDDDASALLVIPEGFTDAVIDGRATELKLWRNPAQRILPEIAEQSLIVLVEIVQSGGRVLAEPLRAISDMGGEAPTEAQTIAVALAFRSKITASESLLFPPAIGLVTGEDVSKDGQDDDEEATSTSPTASIFGFLLPGLSVFAMFMLGDHTMRDVLVEQREGTLRRQLATPLHARQVVVAKGVLTAIVAGIGGTFLLVLARLSLARPVDVVAFFAMCLAVAVLVVGLTSTIYGLCKNERQGSTLGSVVFLVMGFLGGSFLPLDNLPAALQGLVPYNPFAWGVRGFLSVLFEGGALADVAGFAIRLAVLGVATAVLGSWTIQRKVVRGLAA